jgi:hypothetical protein
MASSAFKGLRVVWQSRYASLSRKIALLNSFVLSRLRYGVASGCLSKPDLRRLDGFHVNCLRKLLKIPPSYVSRVSNERVRQMAGQQPLSTSVLKSQLSFLGQVLTNTAKKSLKYVAFHNGDVTTPTTAAFVRRVGRPRQNWTEQLVALMRRTAPSLQQWLQITQSPQLWSDAVARVFC